MSGIASFLRRKGNSNKAATAATEKQNLQSTNDSTSFGGGSNFGEGGDFGFMGDSFGGYGGFGGSSSNDIGGFLSSGEPGLSPGPSKGPTVSGGSGFSMFKSRSKKGQALSTGFATPHPFGHNEVPMPQGIETKDVEPRPSVEQRTETMLENAMGPPLEDTVDNHVDMESLQTRTPETLAFVGMESLQTRTPETVAFNLNQESKVGSHGPSSCIKEKGDSGGFLEANEDEAVSGLGGGDKRKLTLPQDHSCFPKTPGKRDAVEGLFVMPPCSNLNHRMKGGITPGGNVIMAKAVTPDDDSEKGNPVSEDTTDASTGRGIPETSEPPAFEKITGLGISHVVSPGINLGASSTFPKPNDLVVPNPAPTPKADEDATSQRKVKFVGHGSPGDSFKDMLGDFEKYVRDASDKQKNFEETLLDATVELDIAAAELLSCKATAVDFSIELEEFKTMLSDQLRETGLTAAEGHVVNL